MNLPKDCRTAADCLRDAGSFETGQTILHEAADEIERLRAALAAIEQHGSSVETYDPVVSDICRRALSE